MSYLAWRGVQSLLSIGALVLFACTSAPLAGQQADSEVTLKAVKYSELGGIVRQLKGKVVVVDFWADY
jgi:hypothetical protein